MYSHGKYRYLNWLAMSQRWSILRKQDAAYMVDVLSGSTCTCTCTCACACACTCTHICILRRYMYMCMCQCMWGMHTVKQRYSMYMCIYYMDIPDYWATLHIVTVGRSLYSRKHIIIVFWRNSTELLCWRALCVRRGEWSFPVAVDRAIYISVAVVLIIYMYTLIYMYMDMYMHIL